MFNVYEIRGKTKIFHGEFKDHHIANDVRRLVMVATGNPAIVERD